MKKTLPILCLLLLGFQGAYAQSQTDKGFASTLNLNIGADLFHDQHSGLQFRLTIPFPNPYFRMQASYTRYDETAEDTGQQIVAENVSESTLALQTCLWTYRYISWYASSGVSLFNYHQEIQTNQNPQNQDAIEQVSFRKSKLLLNTGLDIQLSKRMGAVLEGALSGKQPKFYLGLRFNLMPIEYPEF